MCDVAGIFVHLAYANNVKPVYTSASGYTVVCSEFRRLIY